MCALMKNPCPAPSLVRRGAALLIAGAVAFAPVGGGAQTDNLPRLGDAGADELTPAAERRLGEQIMRSVRRDVAVSDDVEISEYLNRLVARLASTPAASGFSFEPFLVRDGTLNAFALPGGFIGVHTGLITAAVTESELASVLAHEIGHVTQRHIARMLSQQRLSTPAVMAAMVLAALAARSNPQAAMGAVTMVAGAQQQQMLAFSRDAEREADRVAMDTIRQADFDPAGMVDFFGRLQRANRLNEDKAPGYMRSHPLTVERIADLQARLTEMRYRQRLDSVEFRLVRARLAATADTSVDGLGAARARFERALRDRSTTDELSAWYGIAAVALAQRDFGGASRAIGEARVRIPAGHPYVERLAAEVQLRSGDPAGALATAEAASARFAGARALGHLQAEAMIESREFSRAAAFLEDQLTLYRSDPVLWRLLSRARNGLGQTGLAHRATAEEYALAGGWLAALEQLRLAQRSPGLDFYTASRIDARIREVQAEYTREQQDRAANR
ncbi:MAG: hypothetical protein RIS35_413 [Pseudomonadota bacterium]|jgi:predicted Zn-dependent protease